VIFVKIDEELNRRGIVSPFDLTEFDQWVNDATREDLATLAEQDVFGLKMWEWKFLRGDELRNAKNFEVDYVIPEDRLERVKAIIESYEMMEGYDRDLAHKTVREISGLAVYSCIWV
jgi:hypothetical protein